MEETKTDKEKILYYNACLETGKVYIDRKTNEQVEYQYMGQTGYAIVCEPGDSGGGMQSCWGLDPERLEEIVMKPHKK